VAVTGAGHTRRGSLRDAGKGNFERRWSLAREGLWMVVEVLLFRNPLQLSSGLRVRVLRRFGATVGRGVRIREGARVKYPWLLTIGDHCWIGEGAWLYNQAPLAIGDDVCVSQGASLLCGTHDLVTMDLEVAPVAIGDRVWLAAGVTVLPGTTIAEDVVVGAGSVVTRSLDEPGSVYAGSPARRIGPIVERRAGAGALSAQPGPAGS
jgi:putative colanic acid biosynthesis acetyltransferase WcaF